jgi:hypothetical protein
VRDLHILPNDPYVLCPAIPPAIPFGWTLGPPDYVGVGTMKSGTSWWWSVLNSHPKVANPKDRVRNCYSSSDPGAAVKIYASKETHFFDHYGQVEDFDPALYHRYFPRPPGSITGEWTPRYIWDFWTPQMLRAAAPDAKLLVLLRDPLDRFISGLAHHLARGLELTPTLQHHHFSRGLYWQQLKNLLTYFDRAQVLVLQYEQCVAEPVKQARRTFDFLGLDPYAWQSTAETTQPVAATVQPKPILNKATIEAIRHAYQFDLNQLLVDFPEIDGLRWPTAAGGRCTDGSVKLTPHP